MTKKTSKEIDDFPRPEGVKRFRRTQKPTPESLREGTLQALKAYAENRANPPLRQRKKSPDKILYSLTQAGKLLQQASQTDKDVTRDPNFRPLFKDFDTEGKKAEFVIRAVMAYFFHLQHNDKPYDASTERLAEMIREHFPDNPTGKNKSSSMAEAVYRARKSFANGVTESVTDFMSATFKASPGHQFSLGFFDIIRPNPHQLTDNLRIWADAIKVFINQSNRLLFEYPVHYYYGPVVISDHPIDIVSISGNSYLERRCHLIEIENTTFPQELSPAQLMERLALTRAAQHLNWTLEIQSPRISLVKPGNQSGEGQIWHLKSDPEARSYQLSESEQLLTINYLEKIKGRVTKAK